MMKVLCLFLFGIVLHAQPFEIHCPHMRYQQQGCVEQNQMLPCERVEIVIPRYEGAYNPTIVKNGEGYTLICRYDEEKEHTLYKKKVPCMTYLVAVDLNQNLKIVSPPKVLGLQSPYCEDPRAVMFKGDIVLFFNEPVPRKPERRVMRMALIDPKTKNVKKVHTLPGAQKSIEKNWTPFLRTIAGEERLFFVYEFRDLSVYEVLFEEGGVRTRAISSKETIPEELAEFVRQFGAMRGGAPLLEIEGQYWNFFHAMFGEKFFENGLLKHYYFYHPGLTTIDFETNRFTRYLPYPLLYDGAFAAEKLRCPRKWILYPSGALYDAESDTILLAFGENDSAIFLAKYAKTTLQGALKEIE